MGVSGSGKMTIGSIIAERKGWTYYDGDDFYPSVNADKMTKIDYLSDSDRQPWLWNLT